MKTKDMTLIAVMAALICVAGPLSIAIGPIPLSLASFAVYLAGAVLGAKRGPLAVAIYLLIGLVGVPVFSGFSGGFQKLIGVTGGYLVGYLPCALLTGLGVKPGQTEAAPKWLLPAMHGAGHRGPVRHRHGLVHDPDEEHPGRGHGHVRDPVPAGRRHQDRRRHAAGLAGAQGDLQITVK